MTDLSPTLALAMIDVAYKGLRKKKPKYVKDKDGNLRRIK